MALDIMSLIMGLIDHQTEGEKASLFNTESQDELQNQLKYDPQIQNAKVSGLANTLQGLGSQSGSSVGLGPGYSSAMYNSDGSMNPAAIGLLQKTQAANTQGVPSSDAATQLAQNAAASAVAGKTTQDTSAGISPQIKKSEQTIATNTAQDQANKSAYPLTPTNQDLQAQDYSKSLLATLAGANRSTLDSTLNYPAGSRYGYQMNPYTGSADVRNSPFPSFQTTLLTGQTPATAGGQPIYDAQGNRAGTTPHDFDPGSLVPDKSHDTSITPPIGGAHFMAQPNIATPTSAIPTKPPLGSMGSSLGGQDYQAPVVSHAIQANEALSNLGMYLDHNGQLQRQAGRNPSPQQLKQAQSIIEGIKTGHFQLDGPRDYMQHAIGQYLGGNY